MIFLLLLLERQLKIRTKNRYIVIYFLNTFRIIKAPPPPKTTTTPHLTTMLVDTDEFPLKFQ